MKIMRVLIVILIMIVLTNGCLAGEEQIVVNTKSNVKGQSIRLYFKGGEHWHHDFKPISFLPFIKLKPPPQIAVWVEDLDGKYLETLYVTEKLAKQGWSGSGEIRRKEALPYWAYKQGRVYEDGLLLPTKENPLPDTITGATPKEEFVLISNIDSEFNNYRILVEVNQSCDFNENFAVDAKEGEDGFSGGKLGSGQPAVIYSVEIPDGQEGMFKMELIGHSSPDGSDGKLYQDLIKLDTAVDIIDKVIVEIK